jgi:DNA-directed RNA polymerase specialized sigma24 family protein
MMRRLLINHAKSRHAAKRGGSVVRVPLDDSRHGATDSDLDLLDLDRAIAGLAEVDPVKAELIELQYFGGLSLKEIQIVTGLSPSSLDRSLRLGRAWLKDALTDN